MRLCQFLITITFLTGMISTLYGQSRLPEDLISRTEKERFRAQQELRNVDVTQQREIAESLVGELSNRDSLVVSWASDALNIIGEESIAPTIESYRRGNLDPGKTAQLLSRLRTTAIPTIRKLLQSSDDQDKLMALDALNRMSPRYAYQSTYEVTSLLTDFNEEIRGRAAETLGSFGYRGKEGIPGLIVSLEDNEESVRIKSAMALGRMGKDADSAVTPLLNSSGSIPREVIGGALKSIGTDSARNGLDQMGRPTPADEVYHSRKESKRKYRTRDSSKTRFKSRRSKFRNYNK